MSAPEEINSTEVLETESKGTQLAAAGGLPTNAGAENKGGDIYTRVAKVPRYC